MGCGEYLFMTTLVTKRESSILNFQAINPFDKARPIGSAAKFSIGNGFESHRFLEGNSLSNGIILRYSECDISYFATPMVAIGLH